MHPEPDDLESIGSNEENKTAQNEGRGEKKMYLREFERILRAT